MTAEEKEFEAHRQKQKERNKAKEGPAHEAAMRERVTEVTN